MPRAFTGWVLSDAHEGTEGFATKVLGATAQRCRVHFMRNAFAHAGKSGRQDASSPIWGDAFQRHITGSEFPAALLDLSNERFTLSPLYVQNCIASGWCLAYRNRRRRKFKIDEIRDVKFRHSLNQAEVYVCRVSAQNT